MCKIVNQISSSKIKVFFPSTIFINENKKNIVSMLEQKRTLKKLLKKLIKILKELK